MSSDCLRAGTQVGIRCGRTKSPPYQRKTRESCIVAVSPSSSAPPLLKKLRI